MSVTRLILRRRRDAAGSTGLSGIAIAALLGSTGCTTLGGNVSGDFACRAPGGSCSPMSAIDARAVQTMVGEGDAGDRGIAAAAAQTFQSRSVSGPVARTGERTLRVVFPAHVDRAGVLHDEATAHVVVEDAAWTIMPPTSAGITDPGTPGTTSDFEISRSPAPSSLREAIAGASAPAIEGLESLPAQAPHPIVGVDAPLRPGTVPGPTPDAIAAARSGRRIARPGAIDLNRIPVEGLRTLPPRGPATKVPAVSTGKPLAGIGAAIAAGRVRALAQPALSQLEGKAQGEPDLDGVFAPATKTEGPPK